MSNSRDLSTLAPETKSNQPIKIVIDLLDALASPLLKKDLEKKYLDWFKKNNLIINVNGNDILLHPGAIEFIRYLYEKDNVTLSFFNYEEAEINKVIVSKILKRALCDKAYKHTLSEEEFSLFFEEKIKNNIFSRGDFIFKDAYFIDLKTTLKPSEDLNSTLLISPNREILRICQRKHGFTIGYADARLFKLASEEPYEGYFEIYKDDLRGVNHLYYTTGVLEKLFSSHSTSIAQSLLELQYKEDGTDPYWLHRNGIALVSYHNHSDLNTETLKNISYRFDYTPVLIHLVDTNEIMLFGKPNSEDWALTQLDSTRIGHVNFPEIGSESTLLLRSRYNDYYFSELNDEIKSKNGHTVKKYEPRFELSEDKSLYVSGFNILRKFATQQIDFYGHQANQYFGIENDVVNNNTATLKDKQDVVFFREPPKPMAINKTKQSGISCTLL